MNSEKAGDGNSWYVIHTNPGQEERADSNLKAWNVQTFTPKLRERRYNQYTGRPTELIKPLFPRYIFARFDAGEILHKVRFTRGVSDVVSFGSIPTPVHPDIIKTIWLRTGKDGFVNIGEEIKPGDEIVVKEGPLKDFIGVFERDTKDAVRVMVLLKAVSYQAHVVIKRDMIRKLNSACPG